MAIGACLVAAPWAAAQASLAATAFERGLAYRQQGQLSRSISELQRACRVAPSDADRMLARGELGASLLQARRLDEAEASLQQAYAALRGAEQGRVALDLGNLAVLRNQPERARSRYQEALRLAGADAQIEFPARLNLARLAGPVAQLDELDRVARDISALPDSPSRTRWQINLGEQYHAAGQAGLQRAHQVLLDASRSPAATGQPALLAQALDGLAQLYEDQQRPAEAIRLSRRALALIADLSAAALGDLPVQLEWRLARSNDKLGRLDASLAAYQRAVHHLEALRQDLPIEDDRGRSTYRTVLQPLYLGLVDSLLAASDRATAAQRDASLRQVIDTVELLHQSELQDYLGDRCEVDAVKGGSATVIPGDVAVLYPIVLSDRVELLLETAAGISRHRSAASAQQVRLLAAQFARNLRAGGDGTMAQARQLYDWILRPIDNTLLSHGVKTLVVVPEGALRLVAVGAFHDGSRYAIEKYAIATATGMSMTNTERAAPVSGVLLAGLSVPGSVVDKLSRGAVTQLLGPQAASQFGPPSTLVASRALRSMRGAAVALADAPADQASRSAALRDALSLPGVGKEVAAIGQVAGGTRMLDQDFTVDNFRREAESGRYSIIHLASHGVFGGRSEATYLLAYDDLLTLDRLQSLLRSDALRRKPIELLSLSACETAEGDERSPLGLSGAAIKARARSVMGSLWPVSDDAAVLLMSGFYRGLLSDRLSKAQALQRSQIELLRKPGFDHPFYWAPFILIGNWF